MRSDFGTAMAKEEPWREQLIYSNRKPVACLANCITILEQHDQWKDVLEYNEFTQTVSARTFPPAFTHDIIDQWTDQHDRLAAAWIQAKTGILAGQEMVGAAILTVAQKRPFHPVREYLDSLKWDGQPRIDMWFANYLGVDPTPYAMAIGPKWLISAVARIMNPGCKVDTAIILEGAQGKGKSSALQRLCPDAKWFTDNVDSLGSKDSKLQSRGVWIVELGELSAMSRADVEHAKSFMSCQVDRFRPPYGKHLLVSPRQCVYAGTTNRDYYFNDDTGNRRLWPIRCAGRIELQKIQEERDQLWAEALHRLRSGSNWWLNAADQALADSEAQARMDTDIWQEPIMKWLEGESSITEKDDTSVEDILADCIKKDRDKWNQQDKNRVARVLIGLGWERYRKRLTDKLHWRYRRNQGTVREQEQEHS